jgi:hypothetical protein
VAGAPYGYPVVASDPDGDPLSYHLLDPAPSGMTINFLTGLLNLPSPTGFTEQAIAYVEAELGQYQVVVPTGTFDVKFTPPTNLALGTQTIPGVVVAGNKVVNGTLPPGVGSYCTAGLSASGCQALLSFTGTASPTAGSGFIVQASTVEGQKDGLFFFAQNGRQANSWGNGTSFQCVVPPVNRAGLIPGGGTNGACNASPSQDLNARWCPTCPKPNHAPTPGVELQVQFWYRDPQSTSNQSTSLSDALAVGVLP